MSKTRELAELARTITIDASGNLTLGGQLDLGTWTVTETSGSLFFAKSGTNKWKLDGNGNITAVGDLDSAATIS